MKVKMLVFEDGISLLKFVKQHPEGIVAMKILPDERVEVTCEFYSDIPVNRLISVLGSNQFRLRSEK